MLSISIIKYCLVGLGGYLVYLLLMIGMVEVLNLDPVLASFLSFIPSLIISYTLSRNWVFSSSRNHRAAVSRYLVVIGISLILNVTIMYITIHWLGWWYIYSQILVVVVVPINNYVFNYLWVFKEN